MVRNIIFVFQMKNSIPRYTFYKNKYGSELLVDVVELKYVKKFLAESAIHTLNYYDVTFITEKMQKRMDYSSDRPDNILLSISYALLHQESVFVYTRCVGR